MDLSIVIPAFNEAGKIGHDVEAAASFLHQAGLEGEIIVVDDGSADETSGAAGRAPIPPSVRRKVLRLEKNAGKGAAVRHGILASQGKVVLYADSGTCIPYANGLCIIKRIAAGDLDLGLASRRLPETVIRRNQLLKRRLISWLFHRAAILITGLPRRITDSQCGFKIYKGEVARRLFAGLETSGFLFELEIILKALRSGLRLEEFPVEWTCDRDTRFRPAAQAKNVLRELFRVRSILKKNSG